MSKISPLSNPGRINTIRALACGLLVFNHSVADVVSYTNMDLHWPRTLNEDLAFVRMPLFSFLSGVVYACRPVELSGFLDFHSKKIRRLIVPLLCLTIILLGMKSAYPGATAPASLMDLPHYLMYGYSHLWFLQSLFLIFLFISSLELITHRKDVLYPAILVGASLLNWTALRDVEAFSLGGALYLLPFFAAGALVRTHIDHLEARRWETAAIAAVALGIALSTGATGSGAEDGKLTSLLASLSALILIFSIMPHAKVLGEVGRYSFSIYLFHSVFAALALRLFPTALIAPYLAAVFLLSLLAPILLELVIRRQLPMLSFVIGLPVVASSRPRAPAAR